MKGPGYEANGWKGETRYKTTEVIRVVMYTKNVLPMVSSKLFCHGNTNKDKTKGGKTRRDANAGTLRGSSRLNIKWHPLMKKSIYERESEDSTHQSSKGHREKRR
jgi:hypothetical protein